MARINIKLFRSVHFENLKYVCLLLLFVLVFVNYFLNSSFESLHIY